jgi:hypothetical protein
MESATDLAAFKGTVIEFDAQTGLGLVQADQRPGATVAVGVPFHCVSILDGSRSLAVGAVVRYRLGLRLGRFEALDIEPLSQAGLGGG